MLAQLQHLKTFKPGRNCEFRILPRSAILNTPRVLSFALIDNAFAVSEARTGMITSEDDETISELNQDFEALWSRSVWGEEQNKFIDRALEYYRSLPV